MTKLKTLMLIAATTVLTTGIGLPAWSALHGTGPGETLAPLAALPGPDAQRPLVLADSEEHEEEGGWFGSKESDDHEEGCDDDDEGACGAAAPAAPAPAGNVPPPQSGLFDTPTAPKATVK